MVENSEESSINIARLCFKTLFRRAIHIMWNQPISDNSHILNTVKTTIQFFCSVMT